ncbi:MAG: HDOD domain-containing protein [Ignavibacteriaceae bacterium]|nr:HDOD domain-containing protein [Ignavibacteriaceae bacterium]
MNLNDEPLVIKRSQTEKILGNIKDLPSIPKVIFEVTKLLGNSEPSAHTLSGIIIKDAGLTTKLLAIANSPLYGIKRKVSSLEFAILVLGFQEIKSIVTALSLADSFKITGDKYFSPLEFWIHSMVTGSAAKGISQHLGFNFGSDAFVAGALHDLGIMVIHKYLHKQYNEIVEFSNHSGVTKLEAELEILGMSHQEIGKFLAEKWALPILLCDTLQYHHDPLAAKENKSFVAVIHLVDYMTHKLNIGSFYWDDNFHFDLNVLPILGISSEKELEEFIQDYEGLFSVTASSIRI